MTDFVALSAAVARDEERRAHIKAECEVLGGCDPKCQMIQRVFAGYGVVYDHWTSTGEHAELELPNYQPHWKDNTFTSPEVLKWLRSLHPVSDTVCSESEPEVYKLMRGES